MLKTSSHFQNHYNKHFRATKEFDLEFVITLELFQSLTWCEIWENCVKLVKNVSTFKIYFLKGV